MIIITGAAGFIASNLLSELNNRGYYDVVLVDDFSKTEKVQNYNTKKYTATIERSQLFSWLNNNHKLVQFIFHLGARTDTTEFNQSIFDELNLNYSKQVWHCCVKFGIPLIYASSAATYGNGEYSYIDNHEIIPQLKPLNPYGCSKNEFDKWVLFQEKKPYFWAGIKFFNVYGPNEYHKGRMASVVFHAFNQIKNTGWVQLFRSHNPNYLDGEQLRDFIYVKDTAEVLIYFMLHRKNSGIYNLGTGKARSFNNLAQAIFNAMKLTPNIKYIDTPCDIRNTYQYFTEANMNKLRSIGYQKPFTTLEDGVNDYVRNYLLQNFKIA